jgi:hypothetical protein
MGMMEVKYRPMIDSLSLEKFPQGKLIARRAHRNVRAELAS